MARPSAHALHKLIPARKLQFIQKEKHQTTEEHIKIHQDRQKLHLKKILEIINRQDEIIHKPVMRKNEKKKDKTILAL